MDRQLVDVDRRLQFGLCVSLLASQQRLDAGRQHPRTERLGDVIVGAAVQPRHHVALFPLGRQHDDRNVAGLGIALEPAADLEAVHRGQHPVEHDQVGRLFPRGFERFLAGAHALHAVTVLGELVTHQFQQILLVVNHEDLVTGHRFVLFCVRGKSLHGSTAPCRSREPLGFRESPLLAPLSACCYESSISTSSAVRLETMLSSARTIDSASSRLRSCSATIFSSTVSRAISR